ncbi:MAG: hypothetical protein AAGB51_06325 [Planctomycetota bacterium]
MTHSTAQPERVINTKPLMLKRASAAMYLDVSLRYFDTLVEDMGIKPLYLPSYGASPGAKGPKRWRVEDLDRIAQTLVDRAQAGPAT